MVMTTDVRTQTQPLTLPRPRTLPEVAQQLGIPLVVRPWWGSRRSTKVAYCRKCGGWLWGTYCHACEKSLRPRDILLRWLFRREWLCPANRIRWPEVLENGSVVVWEGPCGKSRNGRHHEHRQDLEVVDVGETAFLLRATVVKNTSLFIVGLDDGRPFARMVSGRVTTLQDAFDWLVPKKVQEALILGLDVKRQGDWWFIPTNKEPRRRSDGRTVYTSSPALSAGKLYRGAALCWNRQTRHTGGMVVYQSVAGVNYQVPFVKGEVKAPDHPTLTLPSWHMAIRNRSTPAGDGQDRPDD
ncbi:hypothetical protein LCGC14_0833210 [marine sediment metagenome]|uniref:Uncharacterized protein n=1 Tax=marine sediment metagenome TaxID=412755 RepID=A0A0F9S056_9ZZZZ